MRYFQVDAQEKYNLYLISSNPVGTFGETHSATTQTNVVMLESDSLRLTHPTPHSTTTTLLSFPIECYVKSSGPIGFKESSRNSNSKLLLEDCDSGIRVDCFAGNLDFMRSAPESLTIARTTIDKSKWLLSLSIKPINWLCRGFICIQKQ